MAYMRRGPMRRADARVAYVGNVRAFRSETPDPAAGMRELVDVTASDLSAGGMRLQTATSGIAAGDVVAVVFAFRGTDYRVLGRVAWASPTADRMVEFAIQFESLSPSAKRALGQAIVRSRFQTGGFLDRRRAS